jgi:hypothetical protein
MTVHILGTGFTTAYRYGILTKGSTSFVDDGTDIEITVNNTTNLEVGQLVSFSTGSSPYLHNFTSKAITALTTTTITATTNSGNTGTVTEYGSVTPVDPYTSDLLSSDVNFFTYDWVGTGLNRPVVHLVTYLSTYDPQDYVPYTGTPHPPTTTDYANQVRYDAITGNYYLGSQQVAIKPGVGGRPHDGVELLLDTDWLGTNPVSETQLSEFDISFDFTTTQGCRITLLMNESGGGQFNHDFDFGVEDRASDNLRRLRWKESHGLVEQIIGEARQKLRAQLRLVRTTTELRAYYNNVFWRKQPINDGRCRIVVKGPAYIHSATHRPIVRFGNIPTINILQYSDRRITCIEPDGLPEGESIIYVNGVDTGQTHTFTRPSDLLSFSVGDKRLTVINDDVLKEKSV